MGSAARGSRLLSLMRDYPQLIAEMEEQFERRAEQISAAGATASAATPTSLPTSSSPAAAAATPSPAASSHASLALLPSQHRVRLDTLREHALVPGTIALVLSFVPVLSRMHLGRVSRRWQSALHQPSLWVGSGWHGWLHGPDLKNLSPITARHMTVLRCGVDWLLRERMLRWLRHVPQLRRLAVLSCWRNEDPDVSAASVRQTLQSLQLEALILPSLEKPRCQALVEALAALPSAEPHAAASSSLPPPPLLARWAPSLTELRLTLSLDRCGSLLQALSRLHWPELRCLAVCLMTEREEPGEDEAVQLLQQAVSTQRMPRLRELQCGRSPSDRSVAKQVASALVSSVWLPMLPRLSTLTSLTIGSTLLKQPLSAPTLFRIIGAHNLPSLHTLRLHGCLQPSVGQSEVREVEQILQRMEQLTQLTVSIQSAGGQGDWLRSLHLLPSLLTLSCEEPARGADQQASPRLDPCLQSISAAPKLQSLSFSSGRLIGRLGQLWWHRLGQPHLDLSGVNEDRWQELQQRLSKIDADSDAASSTSSTAAAASSSTSVASSVPAIRELRSGRHCEVVLDGCAFAYLAHLPHLHTLDCALESDDLGHLSLLRQLRSLTLWLHDSQVHWLNGAAWTGAAVRAVGSSRLPLLHTLRLEGDDEDPSGSGIDPADPNFIWQLNCSCCKDMEARRATHVAIPVDHGLDHLLRLPALTRLALPYVDRDALDLLRCMAADDRPALHIERIIPHSRRSDFDKRWIEHDLPTFPQECD